MSTPEEIFEAACTIRLELPRLLGSKAESLDQQLANLLNQDRATPDLDDKITDLLIQEEATRKWMQTYLKDVAARSLQPSTQDPSNPIKLPKFACPHGDCICWYRHSVGEPIPLCPTHKIPLVRVTDN